MSILGMFVCLSACLQAYIRNLVFKLEKIRAHYQWPGSVLFLQRCDMYFRFRTCTQ